MSDQLTHIDENGNASMVNIGAKKVTLRRAMAEARVSLPAEVVQGISGNDIQSAKGPVFQTAIIAGIQGAKRTGELIPLCHPLALDHVGIKIHMEGSEAVVRCEASLEAKTGVEMEALTGASIAALTIYDMCKALSHDIVIHGLRLIEKSGGKNDFSRS